MQYIGVWLKRKEAFSITGIGFILPDYNSRANHFHGPACRFESLKAIEALPQEMREAELPRELVTLKAVGALDFDIFSDRAQLIKVKPQATQPAAPTGSAAALWDIMSKKGVRGAEESILSAANLGTPLAPEAPGITEVSATAVLGKSGDAAALNALSDPTVSADSVLNRAVPLSEVDMSLPLSSDAAKPLPNGPKKARFKK